MIRYLVSSILIITFLTGCSTKKEVSKSDKKSYKSPTMRPYTVHGKRYYPTIVRKGEIFNGRASWYGSSFHGKLTSNGETYNMYAMTAAHKTLPMNTIVKVDNLDNGLSTTVRINDRGPFIETRIIDLSKKAAKSIDMLNTGTAKVRLTILGFEKKGSTKISNGKKLKNGPSKIVLGKFAVQIASFSNVDRAFRTQEKYNNYSGYRAIIKDNYVNNKRVFRVWLSGFKSEAEAKDFINRSKFKYAFIVRE